MPINCVGIRNEPVRARIVLSGFTVETPYVKAFSINRTRGKLVATFSASVEIPVTATFVAGADLQIWAWVKGSLTKRFTGSIKSITTQPHFNKAGYFIVNMTGVDAMGVLENKTFSRRLRSDGFSLWVSIDSGSANRPTRGVSIDKTISNGSHQTVGSSPRPTSSEHSKLIKMPKRGGHKHGLYKRAEGLGSGETAGSAGLTVHDHTVMEKGGPAFGVFSAD